MFLIQDKKILFSCDLRDCVCKHLNPPCTLSTVQNKDQQKKIFKTVKYAQPNRPIRRYSEVFKYRRFSKHYFLRKKCVCYALFDSITREQFRAAFTCSISVYNYLCRSSSKNKILNLPNLCRGYRQLGEDQ